MDRIFEEKNRVAKKQDNNISRGQLTSLSSAFRRMRFVLPFKILINLLCQFACAEVEKFDDVRHVTTAHSIRGALGESFFGDTTRRPRNVFPPLCFGTFLLNRSSN
jgi:hypothetical protein